MNNLQSLSELQPQIIEWARKRNILFPENAPKQRLKLIEECGELASAILKNDVKLQKDAIGDIFVVLVILAKQINENIDLNLFDLDEDDFFIEFNNNSINIMAIIHSTITHSIFYGLNSLNVNCFTLKLDLTECANIAWNEIKDRTGKTVNGTFIKD